MRSRSALVGVALLSACVSPREAPPPPAPSPALEPAPIVEPEPIVERPSKPLATLDLERLRALRLERVAGFVFVAEQTSLWPSPNDARVHGRDALDAWSETGRLLGEPMLVLDDGGEAIHVETLSKSDCDHWRSADYRPTPTARPRWSGRVRRSTPRAASWSSTRPTCIACACARASTGSRSRRQVIGYRCPRLRPDTYCVLEGRLAQRPHFDVQMTNDDDPSLMLLAKPCVAVVGVGNPPRRHFPPPPNGGGGTGPTPCLILARDTALTWEDGSDAGVVERQLYLERNPKTKLPPTRVCAGGVFPDAGAPVCFPTAALTPADKCFDVPRRFQPIKTGTSL